MAVTSFTELAAQELPEGSRGAGHLERVLRAADQGKALVAQVLTFSRAGDQARVPTELGPVVRDAIELVTAALPSTVRVQAHVAEAGCVVDADSGQIGQVVTNLCTNAARSTANATGTVEVRLEPLQIDRPAAEQFPNLQPGLHAVLTVKDNGDGIPADTLERIFDPFFTTRELEGGTGLGLAVVHGIVRAHAGAIDVDSEPGVGTTMRVFLPCVGPADDAIAEAAAAPVSAAAGGRVLLVDDQEIVADALAMGLQSLGHEVVTFLSSARALDAFTLEPGAFDVVVTDQTMPDLTGLELAEGLRAVRGDIPIVLISGLAPPVDDAEEMERLGIAEIMAKPFGLEEIGEVLARVLSSDGP